MRKFHAFSLLLALGLLSMTFTGCLTTRGNTGELCVYPVPDREAAWIRNGEPIEFDGELWYPQDSFDILLDSELMRVGEYKDVEFFIDRADVRPFNRLYTKFGRNKFRFFEKKIVHD